MALASTTCHCLPSFQVVSNTIQASEQFRTRFHQNKIYLLGHLGGSIYGMWAVQQRLDLYAAYIGGSQMVNNRLTDQRIYAKLLQHAIQTGDQGLARLFWVPVWLSGWVAQMISLSSHLLGVRS